MPWPNKSDLAPGIYCKTIWTGSLAPGISFDSLEFLPETKQQTTLEREPDFICVLTNSEYPKGILLHIEFETEADSEMAERVHEYLAIERRRHKMDVLPVVVYIGPGQPKIPNEIRQIGLTFAFPVYYLSQQPFTDFVNASSPEEVTTAILTDFQGLTPEEAIRMILARLVQLKKSRHHLNKFLTQLRTLSRLRKLHAQTQNLIKSMALSSFDFNIEDDIVYIEGLEKGLEKGLMKGIEKGKAEGKIEGKIEGEDLKDHIGTFNMLDKDFGIDLIGGILEITNEKVEAIKVLWELDKKIKEFAASEGKTLAQAAKMLKVKPSVFSKLKEIATERKRR